MERTEMIHEELTKQTSLLEKISEHLQARPITKDSRVDFILSSLEAIEVFIANNTAPTNPPLTKEEIDRIMLINRKFRQAVREYFTQPQNESK